MSTPEQIKSCCAAVYSSDAVALLLGDTYHPGCAALTRRLAALLGLRAGQRVADIASGPGATARLLASEYGATVDGVDFAASSVRRAHENAARAGLSDSLRFHLGDAERIPLPDNSCTFPDKTAAAAELTRILRPGGHLGLADVTIAETGLPDELTTLAAWVACIADARPLTQYTRILTNAGMRTVHTESHDDALVRMIDQIEARLHLARMTHNETLDAAGINLDSVLGYIDIARQAVNDGLLGYALIIAEKPR
jgi:hypothetical protein